MVKFLPGYRVTNEVFVGTSSNGYFVTVTVERRCNGEELNKESGHYTSRILYCTTATARSCEHFPLPGLLETSLR